MDAAGYSSFTDSVAGHKHLVTKLVVTVCNIVRILRAHIGGVRVQYKSRNAKYPKLSLQFIFPELSVASFSSSAGPADEASGILSGMSSAKRLDHTCRGIPSLRNIHVHSMPGVEQHQVHYYGSSVADPIELRMCSGGVEEDSGADSFLHTRISDVWFQRASIVRPDI